MRLHSGAGGARSEQARLDGRDKGLLLRPRPPPPHKSPSGRRRRLLQGRKHFLIPEAASHGRRGWRQPPTAAQLGTRALEGGALPIHKQLGTFSSVLPAPASWMESNEAAVVRGVWSRFRVFRGRLGPSHLCYLAGEDRGPAGTEPGPEPWPPVCNSPGFNASSTCLGCQSSYLQSGSKPRPRGARERTHHHGGDRLARDVGHLDPNLETRRSSAKPAAKIPAAAPSLVNKGTPTRAAPS